MKTEYPRYYGTKTSDIEDRLKPKDKKLLDEFCKYCRITAGDRKIRIIRATLLQIFDIVEKPLHSHNLDDVREYLALLNSAELSPYTKNDFKKFYKKFLKWLHKDWSEKFRNFEDFKTTTLKKAFNHKRVNENTLIQKTELEKLLRVTQTLKWKAILTFLFETGCRPQELRLLKWNNLKFDDDCSEVTLYSPKTQESRTIPIKDCVVHLKRWKQEYQFPDVREDDYIFPNKKRMMMSDNALPKQLKILCSEAKIRSFHPYMFRHTRLTQLYQELPEQIVKKYAGHSADSKMSAVYAHISNKDVKEVLLEKIYNVEEISNVEKSEIAELKKEIGDLKKQNEFIINQAKLSENRMEKLIPMVVKMIKEQSSKQNLGIFKKVVPEMVTTTSTTTCR